MSPPIFDSLHSKPTKYWHTLENGKTQCDLCPRFCQLQEGQRGLCFIRANHQGQIILTSYGRSSGFCIDPIEKKPLNHFLPGTSTLSFGTAGCNLSCKFCQNWDISKSKQMDTMADFATPKQLAEAAHQLGCSSVSYTYNDPIIFHEYAIDIAQACHDKGIKNVAVTSGYVCEKPRKEFYYFMDAANIDLKAFSDEFYFQMTGSHLQPVLDTLLYLKNETNVWIELTTLLIPGKNDSDEELDNMTRWVVNHLGNDIPMHFTAFHPAYKVNDIAATSVQTLKRAREIALSNGVYYAYTGNIHDKAGESTYCHHCNHLLIGRDWYELSDWNLNTKGYCNYCNTLCSGIFDETPGQWGSKRIPVQIANFNK